MRPEKLTISRGEDASVPADLNHVSGRVTMTTYIGVSHQYKIESIGGTIMTAYVQNLGLEEAPRQGEHGHASHGSRSTRSRSRPKRA